MPIHQPLPLPQALEPYRGSETMTTKVWRTNIDEEMSRMEETLKQYPWIAFDTEYPGIIHRTFATSSDYEVYGAMKKNVESTKLIQCGFTLFNENGEIGGTWEFNFSNFDQATDTKSRSSIQFLESNGVDLKKIRTEGVDMFGYGFFPKLLSAFRRSSTQRRVQFVTFQGAYDFAYFLSIINYGILPETPEEFSSEVSRVFGEVYDLKVMAGFCVGLGEHLGLSKLAQTLNITRLGRAHHAGSDSLLTALVFIKLRQDYKYKDSKLARGMLYGLKKRNRVTAPVPAPVPQQPLMCHQNVVSYPPPPPGMMYGPSCVPHHHQNVVSHPPLVVQLMCMNGMYFNAVPLNVIPYPSQTPYPPAAGYTGPLPSYYNNSSCFVTQQI